MIYIFNIIISLICIFLTIIFYYFKINIFNDYFKNHLVIFLFKLLIISMFIYFFIYNFSISDYKIFIVSGGFNFTFFHALEGFLSREIILKDEAKT